MSRVVVVIKTVCVALLLLSTALLLAKRGGREIIAPHQPLASFPVDLGDWNGHVVSIDPQVIEILGAGDFAERAYTRTGDPPLDFFVGYFPSQRTGASIHSPKNCLPGSGWAPVESKYVNLSLDGREYKVNEYTVQKGNQKQLVLYWYQAHGRLVANEYIAKFYLITDSIRLGRSDAALVRIITPIVGNEGSAEAEKRAMQFAHQLVPNLNAYIPV
jgi:EpsI family protein